jgi:hypothetical protein
MDDDELKRIEDLHRPSVSWRGSRIVQICTCEADWPCSAVLRANEEWNRRAMARRAAR